MTEKHELFLLGEITVEKFIRLNNLTPCRIELEDVNDSFGTCAYYRDNVIYIDVKACAQVGTGGRAWSYPGYVTDRTPFGVLYHELGHHVDLAHGTRGGVYCHEDHRATGEDAISGYSPNVYEWFAEIFRLFVTNPDLLRLIRPGMYARLSGRFKSIETRTWDQIVLPERQRQAARNKIAQADRKRQRTLL